MLFQPFKRSVPCGSKELILLCSCETQSGILHPALGFPVRQRHGLVKGNTDEFYENLQRDGAPFPWRKAERVGLVKSIEEKALGGSYCGLPIHKDDL